MLISNNLKTIKSIVQNFLSCQIKSKNKYNFKAWRKKHTVSNPLTSEFTGDMFGFINARRGSIWSVMNELLRYETKYRGNIIVGQDTLAQRVGLKSREQINRIIKKLCSFGFISK